MKFTGIGVAILELICFYKVSNHFLETNINLTTIDSISYYWLMFTVYSKLKSELTLFIYDKPYWCNYNNSWMYNYEYGLTGTEGSAIESNFYKN